MKILPLLETAIATKYEQTIGNTEISISNWYKNGYNSVFGADLSSRIWGVDIRGEATISKGENKGSVVVREDNLIVEKNENRIVPKISAGFTKYFDFLDEKERISLTGEYYYNGDGYSDNIFEDKKEYTDGYLKLTKKEYLLKNNLMENNNFSRQYIAAFITYNKFINNDTTLTINAITNLVDLGTRTTISVANNFTDNVTLGGSVTSVFGQSDSEYMVSRIPGKSADNISLQTSIEIKF